MFYLAKIILFNQSCKYLLKYSFSCFICVFLFSYSCYCNFGTKLLFYGRT
nr:MAG TPA: hypothetical protein [Caudoviricetes sp.]